MIFSRRVRIARLFVAVVGCFCCFTLQAQYETVLELTGVLDLKMKEQTGVSQQVREKIEKNGSLLLTELNNAQGEKRTSLRLQGIDIAPDAAESLILMWEICPFRCDELEVIEPCLNTKAGFQVRNIPMIMEPRAGERFDEDRYQEVVLNYDHNGRITDFCFALSSVRYKQIMRSNLEVTDLRRRSMVVDFVEQFRTAYNRKDLGFLKDIFSDDALIITGKVIQRTSSDGSIKLKPDIQYTSYSKEQYIDNLTKVFERNARINIVFEDVKVNKHRENDDIYGVKLIQHWNASGYSDKGYLFLIWDFSNEDKPQIHVRTWQPFEETAKEKVFDLADFNVMDKPTQQP